MTLVDTAIGPKSASFVALSAQIQAFFGLAGVVGGCRT
jgi:hypothetical protein